MSNRKPTVRDGLVATLGAVVGFVPAMATDIMGHRQVKQEQAALNDRLEQCQTILLQITTVGRATVQNYPQLEQPILGEAERFIEQLPEE